MIKSINTDKLIQGDRRTLAKAITLVESKLDSHRLEAQTLLEKVLPHSGKALRIGITGIPGVGKSTFIETFGLYLISKGFKVAVLAVDPSSPISGGSILGDKTRMETLSINEDSFIRPSPTTGSLGGVAQKTRETMILCDAAGYDIILVETVGVGQSEYQVASMVDFFTVLMLPNSGDELQGIKKGILELADAVIINKSDGDSKGLAQMTRAHYASALRLITPTSFWQPKVLNISALENLNIDKVWEMIESYKQQATDNKELQTKRHSQNKEWLTHLVHEMLEIRLRNHPKVQQSWEKLESKVVKGETTAFSAAHSIIETFFSK